MISRHHFVFSFSRIGRKSGVKIHHFSSPPLCFVTNPFCSLVDYEEKLNLEEKAFVEDPKNAELFYDPPLTEKKRPIEDHPADPTADGVPRKKAKTIDIEVRRQTSQVL